MITSTDHAGRPCILTHNGTPVNQGDELRTFRGARAQILGGQAPHKPSSTGMIYTSAGNFYPSVFDCNWTRETEDHTILEAFANFAAYGKDDQLTEEEIQQFKDYTTAAGAKCWNPNEGTFFGTCQVTGIKGTCATFTPIF
jgi:hypothetical protein